MSNLIKLASDELNEIILNALGRLVSDGSISLEPISPFNIEIPADKSHGDLLQMLQWFVLSHLKCHQEKIAELISEQLVLDGTMFEHVEIAGPGFINFF